MPDYREQHWSTTLPGGWEGEREDDSTLFRRTAGGHGTLAVTLLRESEPVGPELVQELAASTLEEGHPSSDIQIGAFNGLYFAYEEEGVAWREWYLAAGNALFFISYDCATGEEADEAAEVEAIIAHLALTA